MGFDLPTFKSYFAKKLIDSNDTKIVRGFKTNFTA